MSPRPLRKAAHRGASSCRGLALAVALLGGTAGEREEDVVERGPVGGDVVDSDPGAVEPADGVGDRALAGADRDLEDAVDRLGPLAGQRLQRRARGIDLARIVEGDVEALAADLVLELVRGALGDHLAAVDHRDPVGEAVGLVEVLGGEQDGRPGGDPLLDHAPETQPAARVEAGRRLVEEEHRRAGDERGGEVEAAAHPARVGADQALGGIGEFELLEQLRRAHGRLALGKVVEPADHLQVLGPGQVFVDRRVLAGEADLRAQQARIALDVDPGDLGAAAVGAEQGREDADGGRLPRSVRAQQGQHAAGRGPQVDAVERLDLAERFAQAASFDRAIGHRRNLSRRGRRLSRRPG